MYFCKEELLALMLLGSAVPMGALATGAEAPYPQRPVTLVVGYPPGGGADTLARLLAEHMADNLGQKVLIENRPGAASNIAVESVARADPDGYTLVMSGRPNTIHKVMYGHVKYDFERDLAPVGLLATVPNVLVTRTAAPMRTVQDVITLAKAYPGLLTCASSGVGSSSHLLCELFQQETGTDIVHVPYRGASLPYVDVIEGRVDVIFDSLPTAIQHMKAGSVRAMAVMSRQRASAASEIPTIEEIGLAGLDLDSWYGLMAPVGTPSHVTAKLNEAVNLALMNPDVQEAFLKFGYVAPPRPNTPETLEGLIGAETERWSKILLERNIRPAS